MLCIFWYGCAQWFSMAPIIPSWRRVSWGRSMREVWRVRSRPHLGDHRSVGQHVAELRCCPGYSGHPDPLHAPWQRKKPMKWDDLQSEKLRIGFILVSTALLAVIGMVAYRTYKPSKTYGIFLSHHKLGAAVLCRWLKMLLGAIVKDRSNYGPCESTSSMR